MIQITTYPLCSVDMGMMNRGSVFGNNDIIHLNQATMKPVVHEQGARKVISSDHINQYVYTKHDQVNQDAAQLLRLLQRLVPTSITTEK